MHFRACQRVSHHKSLLCRLSGSEAAVMDPQGRLLLEQTGLALLDAKARQGQDTEAATGVYVGVMHMEFIQHLAGDPQS